jgi:sulfite oxidase
MPHPAPRTSYDPDGLNTGSWPGPAPGEVVTAADRFFTRSHAPVPVLDAGRWQLEIGGLVERPQSLPLAALAEAFPRRELTATLVCAGMRRGEFSALGPLPGELPWGPDAASTGRWSGVALREVLDRVGLPDRVRHIEFIGLDRVEREGRRFGYGGSIEIAKALSGDVLLATHLNDSPLEPAHGFPLRAIVPGWIGARSVKWLGRIVASAEPSDNYFQSKAYRRQRTVSPHKPHDVSAGEPLTEMPVNAVIVDPEPGQTLRAGEVMVRGWAIGAKGGRLLDVEVSPDGGRSWIAARQTAGGEAWTWTIWEAPITLAPGHHTLVVRARDAEGGVQPATIEETWNVKGYCNNAWHRVPCVVAG